MGPRKGCLVWISRTGRVGPVERGKEIPQEAISTSNCGEKKTTVPDVEGGPRVAGQMGLEKSEKKFPTPESLNSFRMPGKKKGKRKVRLREECSATHKKEQNYVGKKEGVLPTTAF